MTQPVAEPMVSRRVFRHVVRIAALAYLGIVLVVAFALFLVQQQQVEAARQREALRVAQREQRVNSCLQSIRVSATGLIWTDTLIEAAATNGEQSPRQARQVAAFRQGMEDRLLVDIPPTCKPVMHEAEFRRRVLEQARPPPPQGSVSFG